MLCLFIEIVGVDVVFCKTAWYPRAVILDFDCCTLPSKVFAVRQEAIPIVTCRHIGHTIVQGGDIRFTKCRNGVFPRFRNFALGNRERIAGYDKAVGLMGKELLSNHCSSRNKGAAEISFAIPCNGKRFVYAFT